METGGFDLSFLQFQLSPAAVVVQTLPESLFGVVLPVLVHQGKAAALAAGFAVLSGRSGRDTMIAAEAHSRGMRATSSSQYRRRRLTILRRLCFIICQVDYPLSKLR